MNFLVAAPIAVLIVAMYACVSVLAGRFAERRLFREMAELPCPKCARPVGYDEVKDGNDCSPFEERWDDLEHCHPVCRKVRCAGCAFCFVIRFQDQGDRFGPRVSATDDNGEPIPAVQITQ